ncbi:unnamed protein product [Caenorhabditis angaria]|uniref:Uncharacterized protein n=1 Tax=Caenorhabditis angaria TaxID=860376 RepID=A0A9P1MVZ7_9PELO|nr:unnamed protein product [Caenorhabditis angaria]
MISDFQREIANILPNDFKMSRLDPMDTQQKMITVSPSDSVDPSESRNIFILGLCVLFGWMIVILICASPHLFRNYLKKWIFKHDEDAVTEKIRKAEARLQETLRLAQKPSTFLVDQAALMTTIVQEDEKPIETRIPLGLVEEEDEDESQQEPTTSTNLS